VRSSLTVAQGLWAFESEPAWPSPVTQEQIALTDQQTRALDRLREQYLPLTAATRELTRVNELLNLAIRSGDVTQEEANLIARNSALELRCASW